jgi:hypothetical protein
MSQAYKFTFSLMLHEVQELIEMAQQRALDARALMHAS